jgi:hypothetical protein
MSKKLILNAAGYSSLLDLISTAIFKKEVRKIIPFS